jgi:hypothetical protein
MKWLLIFVIVAAVLVFAATYAISIIGEIASGPLVCIATGLRNRADHKAR